MKPEPNRVLVIDDEAAMRHMLRLVLEKEGYRVSEAGDGASGLRLLETEPYEVVLCDIRMPEMDGTAFLAEMGRRNLSATVIMMSAYGTIDTALDCMKQGAYDYISKPFKPDEVVLSLKKAEERLQLRRENLRLKEALARPGKGEMVFRSAVMEKVVDLVQKASASSSPVLITGETGTGKELVARALHAGGGRNQGPFIAVNCSAISSGLIDSEFFGHGKGAFTGADRERKGLFAAADGGTLFLDEIGELPLDLQPKLLRVLQEGEIRRVGETSPRRVDVRVLAATARNLAEEVEKGRFRDDLFYRLAVVEIDVPPLRDRREDISLLARHFIRKIAERERRPAPAVSSEVLAALEDYRWPGNIRELENFMEKTMIFCRGAELALGSLPWEVRRREREGRDDLSLKKASLRLEQEFIRKALAATGGNRTQAARLLEISLRALMYKMKEYGIE